MSDLSDVIVTPAGEDEAPLVGEILADAFSGDPGMTWISPDPEFPKWCWPAAVRLFLRQHSHYEVYVTEGGSGAALWLPPGAELSMRPSLRVLWHAWRRFGVGSILRFFQYMSIVEKHQPKDDLYYLFAIGVRPASQGHGIGSALLEHVLQECDRRKVGAHTETSISRNVSFYQQHRFEVRGEIALPHNGPPIWLMYREPLPGREE